MKKLLIAATIIGVAVVSSVTTVAAQRVIGLPWTKNIYSVSDPEQSSTGYTKHTVSVFDDGGNKCYLVTTSDSTNGNPESISCVRMR